MCSGAAKKRPCIELLDEAMVEVLRRKTPAERVAMVFDAERTMRLMLEAHLRSAAPDWDRRPVAARDRPEDAALNQAELLRFVVEALEAAGVDLS